MINFISFFHFLAVLSPFLHKNVTALDAESIVGGDYAEEDQFKYQISLELCGNFICGGAIIADNFVLTAAHCVLNPLGNIRTFPFKVVAGTTDINAKKRAVEVDVETIYVHKQSNPLQLTNDIAVLKLKGNLGLGKNSHLEKINLPMEHDIYAGKLATISGYGYSSIKTFTVPWFGTTFEYGGYTEKLLKFAKVKIIDDKECHRYSTNICGHVVQRGSQPEGICSGDSGGPLVYNNTIIGIVSSSPLGCREDKEPATYTRVSSYVSFIHNILKGHPANAEEFTIEPNTSCNVIIRLIKSFYKYLKQKLG